MKRVPGFVVMVLLSAAIFSACTTLTGKTAGEYIDDASITTEANAIIINDPDAQYLKIDVTTTKGNVVLTGFINDKKAEDRIVSKIKQIKGVKSVKSLLKVQK